MKNVILRLKQSDSESDVFIVTNRELGTDKIKKLHDRAFITRSWTNTAKFVLIERYKKDIEVGFERSNVYYNKEGYY